jgi:hypothetical protein
MIDQELDTLLLKQQRLRALQRARALAQRLERELYGEPLPPAGSPDIPPFLRADAPKFTASESETT